MKILKRHMDKKIAKPLPILPIRNARNSFISLPNTPPRIEGELKKAKNREIQTIASNPIENPFLIENKVLSNTSDKPQLKNSRGIKNEEIPK